MTKQDLFDIQINSYAEEIFSDCKKIWDGLAKPLDGFGDFENVICKIASIQGESNPEKINIFRRTAVIFCADNGIIEEGVSQSGNEITRRVAESLGDGISTVCTLGKSAGVDIVPVDIGIVGSEQIPGVLNHKVREGTRNFLKEPAMTDEETLKAIEVGISLVKKLKEDGYQILAAGEMGIGNTTTSTAVLSALLSVLNNHNKYINPEQIYEQRVEQITGRGAGLDDAGLARKKEVIKQGIEKYICDYAPNKTYDLKEYVFHILQSLGGLDIAGLVGLFVGGAIYSVPIVLDGLITDAAAVCAEMLVPGIKHYLIPSHKGRESGNELALNYLGLTPFINGNMALGEGTGAVMLFPILDIVLDYFKSGASFSSYNMEAYERFEN